MKDRFHIFQIVFVISTLALGACTYATGTETGLPNPAAVYCESQGHVYDIRTDASGGQYGVCVFSDGTECDGWDYSRGECAPGDHRTVLSSSTGTVDVTVEAGLDDTTEILVYEQAECAPGMSVYLQTISDPAVVHRLVAMLDTKLELIAQEQCPTHYRLVFLLEDGSAQTFSYACQQATPSFLGGDQDFWWGQSAIAPDHFSRVMGEEIASTPSLDCSGTSGWVMQTKKR